MILYKQILLARTSVPDPAKSWHPAFKTKSAVFLSVQGAGKQLVPAKRPVVRSGHEKLDPSLMIKAT